jgi:hypothetical protein
VRFAVAADPAIEGVVDLRGTWHQLIASATSPSGTVSREEA